MRRALRLPAFHRGSCGSEPKIRPSERKWVFTKEKRVIGGLDPARLIAGINAVSEEFETADVGEGSMSMQVGLLFARDYVAKRPERIVDVARLLLRA
jgi:hypothetical protein